MTLLHLAIRQRFLAQHPPPPDDTARALYAMLTALGDYADAYHATHGTPLGQDGERGPLWQTAVRRVGYLAERSDVWEAVMTWVRLMLTAEGYYP